MKPKLIRTLLLIEDNPGDARLVREMFRDHGSSAAVLTHVECMTEAENYLSKNVVDLILLDLGLPDAEGLEAVRRAHLAAPRVALVVLSGLDDESLAAEALQQGAQDYLIKGQIEPHMLIRALRYAVERKVMEDELFVEQERAIITLNSIGDAVACTDVIGNISFINEVAQKLTGWSGAEALGRPMGEVLQILDASTRETSVQR